jgi:hypothetical protein
LPAPELLLATVEHNLSGPFALDLTRSTHLTLYP